MGVHRMAISGAAPACPAAVFRPVLCVHPGFGLHADCGAACTFGNDTLATEAA